MELKALRMMSIGKEGIVSRLIIGSGGLLVLEQVLLLLLVIYRQVYERLELLRLWEDFMMDIVIGDIKCLYVNVCVMVFSF